jgi:hypothetical protein
MIASAPTRQQCPRCRGPLFKTGDDEYNCLYCGEYLFTDPPPPERPLVIQQGPRKRGRPRKQALGGLTGEESSGPSARDAPVVHSTLGDTRKARWFRHPSGNPF